MLKRKFIAQRHAPRGAASLKILFVKRLRLRAAQNFTKAFCFGCALLFVWLFAACREVAESPKPVAGVKTFYGFDGKIGEPFGVAVKNDEIYVADGENGKILKISKTGTASVLTDQLDTPSQIVFDKNGDLIVADAGSHTIKKVKPGGEVETIAGVANQPGFADGDASAALFQAPVGVAASGDKIFVADTYNDRLRVVENGRVSTLAGSLQGFADGAGGQARFDTPCGIAVDAGGNIIVADAGNRRLRLVTPDGTTSTLAGNGASDLADGSLGESSFIEPTAVAISKSGAIYAADGNAIRVIENIVFPVLRTISDVRRGYADGKPAAARFNRPSGLALDEKGGLFIADAENQVVRVLTGEEIGRGRSAQEIEQQRIKPEEFRRLGEPRWSYDPPQATREIAGTLGEIRGELREPGDQVWFHNGLDIVGGYGETARVIRTEKILRPVAAENFATLRELVRMPTLGYIHLRLGRDRNDRIFGDPRFIFSTDADGKLNGVRIPRGAKFNAGDALGTLNALNHVHLIAGRSGAEMNALDALELPGASDKIAPVIEKIELFRENWEPFETSQPKSRIMLHEKARIVVRAYDRMDGNAERRRLGVFEIGYQILKDGSNPPQERQATIRFDRLPEPDAVTLVYAPGSQSGATGETIFRYIATNKVHGNLAVEDFFDAARLANGDYTIRVFAADYFGNSTFKDLEISINK